MTNLFNNYTFGCENCRENLLDVLGENPSDDEVRRYFLIDHNKKTFDRVGGANLIHLAIPYSVSDGGIIEPFYEVPENLKEVDIKRILGCINKREIVLPERLEDVVIFHAGLPRDTMSRDELTKYLSPLFP